MKKLLSSILSLAVLLTLSATAFANESVLDVYIPTPEEIENQYEKFSSGTVATLQINNIDSDPLLALGVISSYAEDNSDITVLHSIASQTYEELIPILSADDYFRACIISN